MTRRTPTYTGPIPAENGQLVSVKVTSTPDGLWTLAWCHDGGLRVEPFGEPFERVRDACREAAAINLLVTA